MSAYQEEMEAGSLESARAAAARARQQRSTKRVSGPSTQTIGRRREELKTIRVTSRPITSKTKNVVVKDLTSELNKLKNDVNKLQSQVGRTRQQQLEIKNTIRQIESTRNKLLSKRKSLSNIRKTAKKVEELKEELAEKLEKEQRARGSWYGERPTIDFHELTQTLYKKSNYPSEAEIRKALDEHGLAAKEKFKPKTVGEALTRLAYATAELIEGGVTEATLGLAYDPKSNERPLALPLQVAGGIATPTVLDYAFGAVLAKLGITKKGRRLLKKLSDLIDKGDDIPKGLTKYELEQIEKMYGSAPISTYDLRRIPRKTLRTIQEVAEYYEKHPAQYTAGASYVPPEQIFYDEIIDNLGWDDDVYIDFLKTYGDKLNVDKNFLAGVLLRVSLEDSAKVLDEIAVDIPDKYQRRIRVVQEKPHWKPDETTEETIDETTEQEEKISYIGHIGTEPTPVTELPTPGSPPPEETPEPLPPTPPLELTLTEQKKRSDMTLRFFMGPKAVYAVKYSYPRGKGDSVTVEARSLPDAMNRAQRVKAPTRYLPNLVDIKLVSK